MRNEKAFNNLGLVLQSYLYRSESDLNKLLKMGARIRIVKGAYNEPPEIAFPKKKKVDHYFDLLVSKTLDSSNSDTSRPMMEPP